MEIETDPHDLKLLEEEVEAFARGLAADDVAGEALHRETGRIRLFLFHYLHGFAGRGVDSVEPRDLIDFVGTWLIRHVSNVTPESIRSLLHTLGAYFRQRAVRGRITEEELEALETILHNEGFFLSRLEDYLDSVADEDAFDTWLEKRWGWVNITDKARDALFRPLAADHSLLAALGDEAAPPLVDDFVRLITGLREIPSRLARSGRRLSASTVEALNGRLDDPDPLPGRPRQSDAPRVNALFSAAVRLGLCGLESGGRVTVSATADTVESMGRRERLALVLDTIWNVLPWQDLAGRTASGEPSSLHGDRAWLARVIAALPDERPTELRPARGQPRGALGALALAIEDEPGLLDCLVPVLGRAGLWEVTLSTAARRRPRIRTIRPTPLGRRVFAVWAKGTEGSAAPEPFAEILAAAGHGTNGAPS